MSTKVQTNKTLTGIYLQQYIQTILNTLKSLSFHELYMQNQREQLCKTQHYDPLTAFKMIDSFKHNKIVGFQLRSFVELDQYGGYKVTDDQCWQALKCLNKSLGAVSYEDFEEITLPGNIALRNISLSRYGSLEVKVGTMAKVYDIKSTSGKKIVRFFMKEIEYYRELLLRKQKFCQKYGGDLYTFSQQITKGKTNSINFEQFYNFCRSFKFYFNQQEFIAIYKRTKSVPHNSPLAYDNISDISISIQSLSHCLLATTQQLDIKNRIKIISGQPFNHLTQPSYKTTSIRVREQNQKIQKQLKSKQQFIDSHRQRQERDQRDIRYHYCYPEMLSYPYRYRQELKQMDRRWNEDVGNMGDTQVDIRYGIIDRKHYFI